MCFHLYASPSVYIPVSECFRLHVSPGGFSLRPRLYVPLTLTPNRILTLKLSLDLTLTLKYIPTLTQP